MCDTTYNLQRIDKFLAAENIIEVTGDWGGGTERGSYCLMSRELFGEKGLKTLGYR